MTVVAVSIASFIVGSLVGFFLSAILVAGAHADECQVCWHRNTLRDE